MTTKDIWMIAALDERFEAFIDRWLDLDEHTGNRTESEHMEMAEIADAIMCKLIDTWRGRKTANEREIEKMAGERHLLHGKNTDAFWNCSHTACKRAAKFLRGLVCQACDDTGIMDGNKDRTGITTKDVPCPECQKQ